VPKKKTSASQIIVAGLLIVTGLYVVCLIGLTLGQRRLLYYPCEITVENARPAAAKAGFQPWTNARSEFIGWYRANPARPATRRILLIHGNAGCATGWFHYADGFQSVEPTDFYILEYPGYGGRPGSPSQSSILRAADEAFQSVPQDCSIFLVGESLGTGPACYLGGKYNGRVGGVFLVAPYNNMKAAAHAHLPIFPVKWMLRDKYPSDYWLKSYHGPLAVLLAQNDTVIPCELGQKLFRWLSRSKKALARTRGDPR
jgi:uncharacterized protein